MVGTRVSVYAFSSVWKVFFNSFHSLRYLLYVCNFAFCFAVSSFKWCSLCDSKSISLDMDGIMYLTFLWNIISYWYLDIWMWTITVRKQKLLSFLFAVLSWYRGIPCSGTCFLGFNMLWQAKHLLILVSIALPNPKKIFSNVTEISSSERLQSWTLIICIFTISTGFRTTSEVGGSFYIYKS